MTVGPLRWRALGLEKPFGDDHAASGKVIDLLMFALRHPHETVDPVVAILAGVCAELDAMATLCREAGEFAFLADPLAMLGRRVETAYLMLRHVDTDPLGLDNDGPESAPETLPTPRT